MTTETPSVDPAGTVKIVADTAQKAVSHIAAAAEAATELGQDEVVTLLGNAQKMVNDAIGLLGKDL